MKEEHEYLAPDYFEAFQCKMGACRRACCVGWPVSISVDDYFLLMGRECSEELRERLDRGVRLAITPTRDHYAQMVHRYDGDCAMRLQDGRCAIHAEISEDALPDVCRLYPRGVRTQPEPECSLANSCEAVLELLYEHKAPIVFTRRSINVTPPPAAKRLINFPTMGREEDIRRHLIACIQNRNVPIHIRFLNLGCTLKRLEEALKAQDADLLDSLLTKPYSEPSPPEDARAGFDITRRLILALDDKSDSIKDYGEAALSYYGDDDAYARFNAARQKFEGIFPDWQGFFENMLVNHIFFEQFPFQDRPDTLWHEFIAISAVYAVLRFIAVAWAVKHPNKDGLIDVCAAVFRLIEHTSFNRFASRTLEAFGCNTPTDAVSLSLL